MSNGAYDKTTAVTPTTGSQAVRAERTRNRAAQTPRCDIYETADDIVLLADVPGVKPDGVSIMLEKNVLTLEANVPDVGYGNKTLSYSEYVPADYKRTFSLSAEVDRDRIEAEVKDGVLKLKLPKAPTAKARKIPVRAG